jgi:hypothetical protein
VNGLWGEGARWEEAGRRAPHAGRAVMPHSSPEPAAACAEGRVGKEAGRRAPHAERAVMAHSSPCADALMKQTSESLSLEATRYLKVAEGYCVSARAGGEQPEAKDQPQTKVNPIRPCSMTSRRTGGICVGVTAPAGVPGEVRGASPAVSHDITRSAWTDGCCGVCGVGMVRMFHKSNQDRWPLRRGAVRRQSPHSSDEAGNDRGAKGDRKVNAV